MTQGNINNNHVYLRAHLAFFPADAIGAAAKRDGEGTRLSVYVQGFEEPVETDIAGGNKLFFRTRFWAPFFSRHGLCAGDRVRIEKVAEYEYRVAPDALLVPTQ